MNLLFDIGHPGHVHLLKHAIRELSKAGHKIIITVKDIPIAKELLDKEGLSYIDLGKKTDSILGKAITQLKYNWQVARIVRKNKIDLGIGTSITLPHVSAITKMKSIILDDDDDEMEPLFVKYGHPFANVILTPDSIRRSSKNSIYYNGTHELAYLHPSRFEPDRSVLRRLGITNNEPFSIVRFVAFKGHHDLGHKGITLEQKIELVNLLKTKGKVLITSERETEPELMEYKLSVPAHMIHSLMYYATLFVGDSQTMTSEAAILGTPAFKCNTFSGKLSVPNEIENKYGLCHSYLPENFSTMIEEIKSLLESKSPKKDWILKKEQFLNDKISVTDFLVWFIENYPKSIETMNNNPDYQYNFK